MFQRLREEKIRVEKLPANRKQGDPLGLFLTMLQHTYIKPFLSISSKHGGIIILDLKPNIHSKI
jgi:hypothetical protein